MNRFSKDLLKPYFEPWDNVKEAIEQMYEENNPGKIEQMEQSIQQYIQLLEYGGTEINDLTGKNEYILLPLNGSERLEFIKKQIHSRYAFVQLSALFDETRKKAARLSVTH
ncbi:YpoC family protein [Sporosarcina pasteurii]|uniref:YpoC-like domain-containing protein n=1 Tax=Sporosarcina pasteurii TaxID=1474 RepID=A0A380BKY4_SPOPA|nr:hypothetical protein [Sporosarcina pasteurii]MDS9470851.1 hypothetical protein [Sporosarcina pasteurii]QBQ05482.1 hypothetical protein E2C16_07300 [Sporosarcina pasteurii]SUJ02895.1 Uncharacterised protein [Sporosarcina pasteurii]